MLDLSKYDEDQLSRYLQRMFQIADENRDGVVDQYEFKRLLSVSGFAFDDVMIAKLMNQADMNKDGLIEYDEFIPVGVAMLLALSEQAVSYSVVEAPEVIFDDGLEGFSFAQLKDLAIKEGIKKDGVPWNACCPPSGRDPEGERRGPDSCAKRDILAKLRANKAHITGYWTRHSFGQFQAGGQSTVSGGRKHPYVFSNGTL